MQKHIHLFSNMTDQKLKNFWVYHSKCDKYKVDIYKYSITNVLNI